MTKSMDSVTRSAKAQGDAKSQIALRMRREVSNLNQNETRSLKLSRERDVKSRQTGGCGTKSHLSEMRHVRKQRHEAQNKMRRNWPCINRIAGEVCFKSNTDLSHRNSRFHDAEPRMPQCQVDRKARVSMSKQSMVHCARC
jgi:hypothetical protein